MKQKTNRNMLGRRIKRILTLVRANRKYKDALFRFIFRDKKKLLSLYNALNGSSYTDPDALQIMAKDDVIYMQMKEDVSFLISNTLNLYEHQSTWNPNMPIRGFIYLAMRYEEIIRRQDLDIYGSRLVKLPTPKYVVFYNGEETNWDRKELRMSEAFSVKDAEPAIEVVATVLNINYNNNQELLMQCKPLQEYSLFVAKVKEYQQLEESFEEAMEKAIDYCISHDILTDILSESRAEVKKMLLTEYNPKRHIQNEKEISKEEGREEGREEGELLKLIAQMQKKIARGKELEKIAEELEENADSIEAIYQIIKEQPEKSAKEILAGINF